MALDVTTLPSSLTELTAEDRFLLLGCASPQAASLVADCVLKGMMHTDSCTKLEDQVKFPPFQATELQARTAAWE